MDKFLTFPGQQPIYLGDFNFMNDAVRNTFMQLLKGLTGQESPNCILVEATPTKDGVICLDGEIMPSKYPDSEFAGKIIYEVESSYNGSRKFKDGEYHDCYETRIAQGKVTADITAPQIPLFYDLLSNKIKTPTGNIIMDNDAEKRFRFSRVGSLVFVEIQFEFSSDQTITKLCDAELVFIPNAVIPQVTKFSTFIAEVSGSLVNIPAKISFVNDETNSGTSYITVTIPQTEVTAGSVGSINLMLENVI